jgi:hypothetical protein
MIKIIRNPNFTQWWNILVDGKVIDNAKTHANAMNIANKIKNKNEIIVSAKR